MDGSVKDLSAYRLEKAKEDLKTAKDNLADKHFRAAVNRAYYAILLRRHRILSQLLLMMA